MKLVASALVFVAVSQAAARAEIVCEQTDDQIVVTRNGRHVLTYNKAVKLPMGVDARFGRSGFIHPISTPSGRVVTDGYPLPHHTHQHGVFFAWRSASFANEKLNFWEPAKPDAIFPKRRPGNVLHGQVRHAKVLEIINREEVAGFRVQLSHASSDRQILSETWIVTVHSDTGYIDLTSRQTCATELPLTLERFHYGGMAIRGSRQWFPDAHTSAGKGAVKDEFVESCRMLTSEGLTRADGNHSRPDWVCMTGPIDSAAVAITLIPHPTNLRHPQHVRLHPNMPYFCILPTVAEHFTIKPGEPLVSRFRIVVEDGQPNAARLDAIQSAFAEEGPQPSLHTDQ